MQVLKTLDDKPNMAAETTYKLRADANNGILVKLSKFLKFPQMTHYMQGIMDYPAYKTPY